MSTPSASSYSENSGDDRLQITKVCSRDDCEFRGVPQPIGNFAKRKIRSGDSFASECKTCRGKDKKKWRVEHKEYCKEKSKIWQIDNKDYANALRREKRANNREHVNAVHRKCVKKNQDRSREYETFHQKHPDIGRDRWNKWKDGHPDCDVRKEPLIKVCEEEYNGWAARAVGRCKNRGKRHSIPFNIDKSDLLDSRTGRLPEYCAILPYIRLDYNVGPDKRKWASVDRIIPTLGYIKGNVRVISMAANMAKFDGVGDILPILKKTKAKGPIFNQLSLFDDL